MPCLSDPQPRFHFRQAKMKASAVGSLFSLFLSPRDPISDTSSVNLHLYLQGANLHRKGCNTNSHSVNCMTFVK